MTISLAGSGTQTATGSEDIVLSLASAGTFSFHISMENMQAGDTIEFRIKQKILAGDTALPVYYQAYSGVPHPDGIVAVSVPIANDLTETGSLIFTLKQTSGTNRDYKWKVIKY